VIVCVLLLKAAVPMLAAGAAHVRGVPVGEVCAVYGVGLPALHGDHAGHAHHHGEGLGHGEHGSHAGASHDEHCALTALAAFAVQEHPALTVASSPAACTSVDSTMVFPGRDAVAAWRARLKQGPPVFA
jgi:hypothetical protein